ncbi:MAG: hypothetical protein Q8R24_05095 [Legionellaceae bacterium]|nr:hypothetical protein [Legionellaceae bacterium]
MNVLRVLVVLLLHLRNYSLRSKERPYLAHLERKRFRKMLTYPCMLRFFKTS